MNIKKTLLAAVTATGIIALVSIAPVKAATEVGVAGIAQTDGAVFNTASTGILTNGMAVTNIIYPAGTELCLTIKLDSSGATTSNVVHAVSYGDGSNFAAASVNLTNALTGTTDKVVLTNWTIGAVESVRVITSTAAIVDAPLSNSIVTWHSK